jgi:hypothetical protein
MERRRLLSTTRRDRDQHGQILVLFAGGVVLILAIAALVFDVGQNLLDRRAQQNASDAAALAGARYVVGAAYSYHGGCAASGSYATMPAVVAACQLATANGFSDGVGGKSVRVDFPPGPNSTFSGLPGHIQVTIGSTRGSFFQGVLGVAQQNVAAMGVATNQSDIALPFSLLALAPDACGENKITGAPGSAVVTNGTVHVDSSCLTDALLLSGNGVLTAPQCDVVGTIKTTNSATNACAATPPGVLASGDPLRNLMPPPHPSGTPAAVQPLDGGPIPDKCPGGTSPASDADPSSCAFTSGAVNGHTYRIFPGNYPGGFRTSKATIYMEPGIYWIGGGGIQIQSDGRLISKATGDDTGLTPSGGILIYNSADPEPSVVAACLTSPTGPGCYDGISLNGNPGAMLALLPIESGLYEGMVIFVDRDQSKPDDIFLDGANSILILTGTVYVPSGTVRLNGSDSTATLSAQIICWTFEVNGSGASLTLNYDPADLLHVKGVGLVE